MTAALGGVGIFATAIGGLVQGIGAKMTAQAQAKQDQYQAQVAQINAQIDAQNADYARWVGEVQAEQVGMAGAQKLGMIRAAQGASNLDVNLGTQSAVQKSQQLVTAMDEWQVRQTAAKTAYDYTTKATMDMNQAGLYQMAAANASQAGNIALFSSILGTAGTVASKWSQGTQSGLFGSGAISSLGA